MRIAGGKLTSGRSVEENVLALRQVYFKSVDTLRREAEAKGSRFISFANYDYLGLGRDVRVRSAAASAAEEWGLGSEASRLVGGNRTIHELLERELAGFLGVEDSLALVSGYMTNASLLGHLLTAGDLIFVDDLSHNSIVVGCETSRATTVRFEHGNLDHLEQLLQDRRHNARRALIVVEGLYSMDGDIADLPRLLTLRDEHDAWLMVDEAHSIGVLGTTGRGLSEHFGVDSNKIDFIIGTLSKTFAASGGFIAGRKTVMDWLRFTLPAFVYSVGLSPVIAAAVRKGLSIIQSENWRVERLQENSRHFLAAAKARHMNTGGAVGAGVITLQFHSPEECMQAASKLLRAGYFAPPIAQIGIPKDKPRIRFFISTSHGQDEMSDALDVLATDAQSGVRADRVLQLGA
jgi:8-amino-7-oxononanoate synthase